MPISSEITQLINEGRIRGAIALLQREPERLENIHLLIKLASEQNNYALAKKNAYKLLDMPNVNYLLLSDVANVIANIDGMSKALPIYLKIIKLAPKWAPGFYNLANAYNDLNKVNKALKYFSKAIFLDDHFAWAYLNRGELYRQQDKISLAYLDFKKACCYADTKASALHNLGILAKAQHKLDEAIKNFNQALSLDNTMVESLISLTEISMDMGDLHQALKYAVRAKNIQLTLGTYSPFLLLQNYFNNNPSDVFDLHKQANLIAPKINPNFKFIDNKILKIGFMGADFRRHSCSFFTLPLFEGLRSIANVNNEFEIYTYYTNNIVDTYTLKHKKATHYWCNCANMNQHQLANRIYADNLDVLIDISGHTGVSRLGVMAMRPAKKQYTYLAYPNTTGLSAIDYRIVDDISDTKNSLSVEKLIKLPNCFLCFRPYENLPDIQCTNEDVFNFGSFNNALKITDEVVKVWSEILKLCTNARLIIKNWACKSLKYKQNLLNKFTQYGVEKSSIVLLSPTKTLNDHLLSYNQINLALDTWPYNGTTTTCEALAMGVPSLSICGNVHANRVGATILQAVGLPEFICNNTSEYINRAVDLACSKDKINTKYKMQMRQQMLQSTLCDEKQFSQNFINLIRETYV